jgi:prevent-host-death family protein
MKSVSIRDAKADLSNLIAAVQAGEQVVLCCRQKPVARLIPYERPPTVRTPGALRGAIALAPEFERTPSEFSDHAA